MSLCCKSHTFCTCWIFHLKETLLGSRWISSAKKMPSLHTLIFLLKEPLFGVCCIISAETMQFLHMFNVSAERTTSGPCWIISPERTIFCQKCAPFCCHVEYVESCWIRLSKNVSLSAVMLNMLNMLNLFGHYEKYAQSIVPKNIQHIQHDSRKKHIFRKPYSTWFDIFNMTAERSLFE